MCLCLQESTAQQQQDSKHFLPAPGSWWPLRLTNELGFWMINSECTIFIFTKFGLNVPWIPPSNSSWERPQDVVLCTGQVIEEKMRASRYKMSNDRIMTRTRMESRLR
jgi:hypothetical protein